MWTRVQVIFTVSEWVLNVDVSSEALKKLKVSVNRLRKANGPVSSDLAARNVSIQSEPQTEVR